MAARGPRRRVLIVEDEQALRTSYQRFFADQFDLAFAGTGAEALTQLAEFTPEAMVLDPRLPYTDGIALLQRVRESHPALPVVVTTAYVSMDSLMNVLDRGHSGYRVKPFELNELAGRINAAR